jgi:hypothetical protein
MSHYVAKTLTILETDFGRTLIRKAKGEPPTKPRPPGAVDRPKYGRGRYHDTPGQRAKMPADVASQGERIRLSQALEKGTMAGSARRRPRGKVSPPNSQRKALRHRALGIAPEPSTPSFKKRVARQAAPATPSFGR